MNYWKVQTIATEYTCPVQMVAQILDQLTATDVFNAKREDVRELEEVCAIIVEVCTASRLVQLKDLRRHFIRS